MHPRAPTLLELQASIRRSLMHGDEGEASAWVMADGLAPGKRLGIYRNTGASVVATALRLSFPAVRHLVGAQFFAAAARLFAAAAPPRSAWLDEYGADFPEFLAQLPQAAALPYLPDVARLEWQVNLVLHALDAEPLEFARLARLDPAELGQLRFAPHPAARLLRCDFPADAIWRAVLERDDGAMAAVDLADSPVWLLVQRTQSGIDALRLTECQWRLSAALFSRQSLEAALADTTCADAQNLLALHLARGCFTDARSAPAAAPPCA